MSSDPAPLTWVIGRGGLLGRALWETAAQSGEARAWDMGDTVPWPLPERAGAALGAALDRFATAAQNAGGRWRILWCAGSGVVATDQAALSRETAVFRMFLADLEKLIVDGVAPAVLGSIFFASSAGAVYGASPERPPYNEASQVGARSAYGSEKLTQEEIARGLAERTGVRLLIGRISNLYGPGQNVAKQQGLITHIGRATLRREPLQIYVPLGTIRDYFYVYDAARTILAAIARLEADATPVDSGVVKIFASGNGTTISSVLRAWGSVLRRRPGVVIASSAATGLQPLVLTFRSRVWPELDGELTPLQVGIHAVLRSQLAELRTGRL